LKLNLRRSPIAATNIITPSPAVAPCGVVHNGSRREHPLKVAGTKAVQAKKKLEAPDHRQISPARPQVPCYHSRVKIFVDLKLSPTALAVLREGTSGHGLLFSQSPATSVLAKGEPDPQLFAADIAFGQPDPEAIASAGQLKWIQVSSSGITRYDTPVFRGQMAERGIPVTNSASVYSEPCAVHVLSFMLAQARHLPTALQTQAPNGSPACNILRQASSTLKGETALILGYGAIGRRLVQLLRPFDLKVTAYRRKARGDEEVSVITEPQLAGALETADHVINILPDRPETRHFFDAHRFAQLKPGAVFYNIGRGTTVDQAALANALQAGALQAAWLDVTDPEPLPEDHALRRARNCFITPHLAGGHPDETKSLALHFVENFQRFTRNEDLLDRVM
jgi:phosphoglycerate dehydrogenase-like enzyme